MSRIHALADAAEAAPEATRAARAELEAARAEARHAAPSDLMLVRVAVPSIAPEALLEHFPEQEGVLWSPPNGPAFAGIGAAAAITGSGPSRFAEVRAGAEALWARVRPRGPGAVAAARPRLFGGFAFAPGGAASDNWSGFGAARFVLPRITYAAQDGAGWMTLAIERWELERGSGDALVAFERACEIATACPAPAPGQAVQPASRCDGEPRAFERQVEELVERIQRGELSKVVAAREVLLSFSSAIDPVATVVGLREQALECVRFLFRFGDATFLGATPERLLYKRGRLLETEALAGSIDAGADSPERRLQASAKDLEEHALVVSAITSALEPLCDAPRLPARPGVRSLKHLLHLCTPIQAVLSRDAHVLELIERLHPTPAVGGVPTAAALACIERYESFDRGWYAGAIGWFDALDDAEFNVALRSGLVRSDRAWLYAGAGIVRESRAALEYAETTLKLSAMLSALRARR
ncbi:MAG TPA: isochorismate synthase [Polyangiaceae bacterium]|nr:isochorismate synthase [Polyangiaceae bacterium]